MQMNQSSPRRTERVEPLRSTIGDRIGAGAIAIICLTVLTLGAWLNPSAEGHGTHKQLGLAPCMWAVALDKPCPTCGMTTSFSHAGEGSWVQAAQTQPMGMLLVIITATVFWGASIQTITGAKINTIIQPALSPRIFLIFGILLLGAWFYKIATW
jgi:hypothetical protein